MAALITDMLVAWILNETYKNILYKKKYTNKYEKHFPNMYREVGMAVPKTTEKLCVEMAVYRQDRL